MFDDNPNQAVKNDSLNNSIGAAGAPSKKSATDNKVEDIFSKTESPGQNFSDKKSDLGSDSGTPGSVTDNENSSRVDNSTNKNDLYNKNKEAVSYQNQPAMKSMPRMTPGQIMPSPPPAPGSKRNIFLLVIMVVVTIAVVAAVFWWFSGRGHNGDENRSVADQLLNKINNSNTTDQNVNSDFDGGNGDQNNNLDNDTGIDDTISVPDDSDKDGLTDEQEAFLGTSINSADTDNDGLFDREEVKVYKTDPLNPDSDGDGLSDGDEVKNYSDPLTPELYKDGQQNYYINNDLKFSFNYLDGMVLEFSGDDMVVFNDNVNQIKLSIYVDSSAGQVGELLPDISYEIREDDDGRLVIESNQKENDRTPYSTEYNTQFYQSNNGSIYLIKYKATKRSDNHQNNFEEIISSFNFLP